MAVFTLCFLLAALTAVQSKRLVLMGGSIGDTNAVIWDKFIEWSGGRGNARIGVVSAASSDPESSANSYIDLFVNTYGAREAVFIPVHLGNLDANSDPAVVDLINSMDSIFFSGGSQSRIITSFYNDGPGGREASPALVAIRQKYNNNSTVGGSSAGGVCHGTAPMIAGGMSWNALRNGAFPLPEGGGSGDLVYEAEGGLELFSGFIADSHFSERGREGRLVRLLSDTRGRPNGATRGIGLDEGTALYITDEGTPNSVGEVVGTNGVSFPDITGTTADTSGTWWRMDNMRFHYLTEGDTMNLATMQPTFVSWKSNLAGNEENEMAETSDIIFQGSRLTLGNPEFVRVSTSVYNARENTTFGTTLDSGPTFRVDFNKNVPGSLGFGGENPRQQVYQIAYYNENVSMRADE